MIRNVCIHVENEQPLLADLYTLPAASDAGLVCTNVRGLDGKRPVFIDHVGSTFFFPYHVVRFLEIPAGAVADLDPSVSAGPATRAAASDPAPQRTAREGDDGAHGAETAVDSAERLPVIVGAPGDQPANDDPDIDLEIDEGFLQRVRDI